MTYVYRSSSLGACDKALIAARLGFVPHDPPENFLYYYARGEQVEEEVMEWLQGNDYRVRDRQVEVTIDCPMDVQVVGHIDGIVTSPQGVEFIGEVKRMSTPAFEEFLVKTWDTPGLVQKYKWQLSSYMVGTGLPGLVVVREGLKDGDEGVARTRVVEVPKPFYGRTEIVQRVVGLELAAKRGLPDGCDKVDYPCPFFYLHGDDDEGALLPEPPATSRLAEAVAEYRTAQVVAAQAKKGLEDSRSRLVQAMAGNRKVTTGEGVTVTRFMKKGAWKWDEAKMREDGVDVEKYRSQGESEQVRVSGDG